VVSHDVAARVSADPAAMVARAWRWFIGPLTFDAATGDHRIVSLRCGSCGEFIAALHQDLIGVHDFERSGSA
jgi:hypothetical protein